jgi:DNA-directed RNA polymerase subunit RPC12/RpoP
MRFVRLTTIDNSYEANFLKDDLGVAGIPCFLTNENMTNLLPHTFGLLGSGIQVMVPEGELGKAKEVLALRSQVGKVISCPNCNSQNIRFGLAPGNKFKTVLAIMASVVAWAPMGNIRNKYYCNDCKTEFSK